MNTLPAAFVSFWKKLVERDRSISSARRYLVHLYRTGKPIPGYASEMNLNASKLPRGWSLCNLTRLAPTRIERRLLVSTPSTGFTARAVAGL